MLLVSHSPFLLLSAAGACLWQWRGWSRDSGELAVEPGQRRAARREWLVATYPAWKAATQRVRRSPARCARVEIDGEVVLDGGDDGRDELEEEQYRQVCPRVSMCVHACVSQRVCVFACVCDFARPCVRACWHCMCYSLYVCRSNAGPAESTCLSPHTHASINAPPPPRPAPPIPSSHTHTTG